MTPAELRDSCLVRWLAGEVSEREQLRLDVARGALQHRWEVFRWTDEPHGDEVAV